MEADLVDRGYSLLAHEQRAVLHSRDEDIVLFFIVSRDPNLFLSKSRRSMIYLAGFIIGGIVMAVVLCNMFVHDT